LKILIVEDDEYKGSDISRVVGDHFSEAQIERAGSVTSALRAVTQGGFAFIVLDMSLPTFDLTGPGGGGSPQGQGGLEVLRLAKKLHATAPFIVVTQYPDIEIDGVELPLSLAAEKLSSRFGVMVIGCLLYEFDSDVWKSQLNNLLHSGAQ